MPPIDRLHVRAARKLLAPAAGAALALLLALPALAAQTPTHDLEAISLPVLPAAVRWVGLLALFPVIGSAVFARLARRLGTEDLLRQRIIERARRIGIGATIVVTVTAALTLYLQGVAFADSGGVTVEGMRAIVRGTSWGTGWTWQMVAALTAFGGFVLAGRQSAGWGIAWLGGVGSAIAAPLTGHAVEHPWGAAVGIGLHALHLLGGAVWLGTLSLLVSTTYPVTRGAGARREGVLALLVNAYSPVALAGAGTAIAVGLVLALAYVGSFGALFGTAYGRALLIKLLLVGGTAALGAYNWKRVRPVLGAEPGARRLRRSASAELAIGTLLLAVTAVLVALPAPRL